jgi:hypothetical protein
VRLESVAEGAVDFYVRRRGQRILFPCCAFLWGNVFGFTNEYRRQMLILWRVEKCVSVVHGHIWE